MGAHGHCGNPAPQPGPPTPTMGLRFTALGAAPVGLEATILEAPRQACVLCCENNGLNHVFTGIYSDLMRFTGIYSNLMRFTGIYSDLMRFTGIS